MTLDDRKPRVRFIAQEIDICKQLAHNNFQVRKKGLSSLKRLLSSDQCIDITASDSDIIWKGLFTYMWMSDTPLVQEADIETISSFIHVIEPFNVVLLFIRGFFASIVNEWNRISHHRSDKFLMFIRRFLRQIFFRLKNNDWNKEEIELLSSELYSIIQILPIGIVQHLNDVYNEEIAKVSDGNIPTGALILLLKCYINCIMNSRPSMSVVNHINSAIFSSLIRQIKLFIKQKAATALECDQGTSGVQPGEVESENFDPRPGNAHVFLPYIDFDEDTIVEYLEKCLSAPQVNVKARNILTQIIQSFKSVTRLRETINKSVNLAIETTDKGRKRKKNEKTIGSLIKISCKKLEEETEDFELPLKKLRKFHRLAGIAANSKTWTITENSANNKSNNKPRGDQGWTVTEVNGKENQGVLNGNVETTIQIDRNISKDWTVSHNDELNNKTNGSEDWAICEILDTHEKSDTVTVADNESCEVHVDGIENADPENDTKFVQDQNLEEMEVEKNEINDMPDVPESNEMEFELTENEVPVVNEFSDVNDEKTKEFNAESAEVEDCNEEKIQEDEAKKELLKSDTDYEIETVDLNVTRTRLIKKRVSFCETPERVVLFHSREPAKSISEKDTISVPASVVKNRPRLLIPGKKYSIVDFCKTSSEEDEKVTKEPVIKSDLNGSEPNWEVVNSPKNTKKDLRNKVEKTENKVIDEESDIEEYHLDEFFKSPPKKRGRRSFRSSVGPHEIRRSVRLMAAATKLQEK